MSPLPLVMVHGFMGGSGQWQLQCPALGKNRRLITPDLPGFASNAHLQAPDSIAGFAQFVLDGLTDQGVNSFDLLGHSMGGMIVQEMVALAPDRVNRLILYGTASSGNLSDRFESFETSKTRVQTDGVIASARRISASWFLDFTQAREYENCAAIAELSSMQALLAGLEAMKTWDRTDNLPNISCPCLIVWGEADRTYKWSEIERLWRTLPATSLSVLPGCSHAAHMEKPNIFNAVIDDFLAF